MLHEACINIFVGIESSAGNRQRQLLSRRDWLFQPADATTNSHQAEGADDDAWQNGHASVVPSRTLQDHPTQRQIPKANHHAQQ
jgi:hypothetical protein